MAQARYAVGQGVARVVVAGGDGTARLVAGELARAAHGCAGDSAGVGGVVLGVVPVGTANLFARSAGLSLHDLGAAARLAVTGAGRPTDVGWARLVDIGGATTQHPFLVVAGLGHDAATLAAVRPADKVRARWPAYVVPGLRRLLAPGHRMIVAVDGTQLEVDPLWSLLAVSAARLPAGARVVPGARLDDGMLHVVLVSPAGLLGWAQVAATGLGPVRLRGLTTPARTAYPRDHPALRYRGAHLLQARLEDPVPAQVDGDVVPDVVQARLTLAPGGLAVAR